MKKACMNCEHALFLLQGYIDGELDLVNSLEIEEHLQSCPTCSRQYQERMALRAAVRDAGLFSPAPADLQKRIRASIRHVDKPARSMPAFSWRWAAAAALLLAVVFVATGVLRGWFAAGQDARLASEVQSAHVRSLMADHLTDVTSSDQHTVKPWFDGKLDFSPPVVDLAAQGYPLIGGRLDYLDGHPAAALVYRRNKHLINLFIWPSANSAPGSTTINGYHIYHWTQGGMAYWAVSDLNVPEMQTFVQLVQQNFH
jgi:anti-sigma factor (TIGR02949 family)